MKKFYHTFGMGSEHAMKCQPIVAKTAQEAHKKMDELYGKGQWAFQYTEEEYASELDKNKLLPEVTA